MMYDVKGSLHRVLDTLPEGVRLVAVSKYHPEDYIMAAYDEGQRIFGESHEQELSRKAAVLPKDIEWHFIGHLQTNKVKYIAPYINMVEAVDSLKLLREIDKRAARHNRRIDVLLELHIAKEATKYGLTPDDCRQLLADGEWRTMDHVRICGLMMMASNVDDEQQIASEFDTAARFFDEVKARYFADDPSFCERSWGMSDDYPLALNHRTTMVRIGTAIFGPRVY
ncbi:MAG: YggS family pyridoxal phosphate-dependent enzyme [Prevotella sp.]|nr:YggS family pyridoxal phosphate-dependent enzyme [Prevotella sp.]